MAKFEKIKGFIAKSKRVWLILKKPTKKEYEMIAKVSAIGILALGVVGFIVALLMQVFD